jgi:REP element-mobilizing transposase RayT
MAHTYTSIPYHLVFSTKGRVFAISEPQRLWAYLAGIAKNLHYQPFAIGGIGNHIHALVGVPPVVSAAEAVQKLKANSSRWLREKGKWPDGRRDTEPSPSAHRTSTLFGITFRTKRSITEGKHTKQSFFRSSNGPERRLTRMRCSTRCRP